MSVSILTQKIFNPEEYDVVDDGIIGQGEKGLIALAKNKQTGEECAMKLMKSEEFDLIDQKYFIREVCALAAINHPAAIEFKGFSLPSSENEVPVILLEYAPNGDLQQAMDDQPDWYDITEKMIIIAGVTGVVAHFHANGLVHRDLKPGNVLFDKNYYPKLGDYGLAREIATTSATPGTMTGNAKYRAPEVAVGSPPSPSMDVFVLGVLMFQILTGRYPFDGITSANVNRGQRPPIPSSFPEPLSNIIEECWASDPDARPTAHKVLQVLGRQDAMPSKVNWDKYRKYYDTIYTQTDPYMSESTRELRMKCELGDQVDWYKFAMQLLQDDPRNPRAQALAREYLEKSSKDFYMASYQLGLMSLQEGQNDKAFAYFKKGYERDHPESIHQYALCLKNGIGTKVNLEKAEELLLKAGQLGNIDAYVDYAKFIIETKTTPEEKKQGKTILAALYSVTKKNEISDLLLKYEDE